VELELGAAYELALDEVEMGAAFELALYGMELRAEYEKISVVGEEGITVDEDVHVVSAGFLP
jgi:hypothetical protein